MTRRASGTGVNQSTAFERKRFMSDREIESIQALVSEAITSHLGDISALPQAVQSKVQRLYHAFFAAYLGICRLTRPQMTVEKEVVDNLDPEVLDCMQHCLSDYQHLFRQFEVLNGRVRALLHIDGDRFPYEFQACVDYLLSDSPVFPSESILEEILETSQSHR
jgi:hypothetical protein